VGKLLDNTLNELLGIALGGVLSGGPSPQLAPMARISLA
jgi:hypothetical protein